MQLLPASLVMDNTVLLIKKPFKIICKERGHVKCGMCLVEEYFRANDDESEGCQLSGTSESAFGSLKEHLISTYSSAKNKEDMVLGQTIFSVVFMCSSNPAILNKLINNRCKSY